jgi:MFS family permease
MYFAMDKKLSLVSITVFLAYVGAFIRVPIVPLYASNLGADNFEVGLITFGFMIVAGIMAFPLGFTSDKIGRKKLMLAGLGISAVSSVLLSYSTNPEEIILAYLFGGIGMASFAPSISSYVGDIAQRMGQSYGWFTAFMQGGMAFGPALGGFLAGTISFHNTFIISALFFVFSILVVIPLPDRGHRIKGNNFLTSIRELFNIPLISTSWLAVFTIAFAFGVFMPFFPLYARDLGIATFFIGLLFGIQSISNAVGRIPAGYISDKTGKRDPFIVGGMILFSILIYMISVSTTFITLAVIVAVLGLAMGITTTNLSTILAESAPKGIRGLTMSGFNSFLYIGFASSSLFGGKLIENLGSYSYGFMLGSIVCLFGGVVYWYATRKIGN